MTALATVQSAQDASVPPSLVIAALIAVGIVCAVLCVDRFIKNAEMDKGIAEILDREDAA